MYTHAFRNAKTILLGTVLALLVAGCGSKPAPAPVGTSGTQSPAPAASASSAKPVVGRPAPPIKVKDVATGQTISLDMLKGQVVLLNFWATWCPPCKAEMPDLERFQNATKGKVRVVAVGVNTETVDGMKAFAQSNKLTFSIAYDGGEAADTYQAFSIPTSYFVDQNGIIRQMAVGAMPLATMRDLYLKAEKQGQGS